MSPKAIFTRVAWETVLGGLSAGPVAGGELAVSGRALKPAALASGDYYLQAGAARARIVANGAASLVLAPGRTGGPRPQVSRSAWRCACNGPTWTRPAVSVAASASTNAR